MDAGFAEDIDEDIVKEKLNANAPIGIKIFEVIKIKDE